MSPSLPKLMKRLWKHIDHRWYARFIVLLVLMVLASFSEILSIGAVLPFIGVLTEPDFIFEHSLAQPFIKLLDLDSPSALLLPLTVAFSLVALIAGTMRLLMMWFSIRLSFAVGADISIKIYRHTLYQPYSVHISRNSSEVIDGVIVKTAEVIFYVLMPAMNLISASAMIIFIGAGLLYFSPNVILFAFFVFGFTYALIIRLMRNKLKTDSEHIARESTRTLKYLQEGLGGIRDILINGTQESFCKNYRYADLAQRQAQGNNQFRSIAPRYVLEVLGMVLIAVLAYILSKQPGGLITVLPTLAAFVVAMQRLLPVLQQYYFAWSTIHGAQASLEAALELLDQPLPSYIGKEIIKPLPFRNDIKVNNVSFRYNEKTPWLFRHTNLTIKKGSRIGFVGTTGTGKSTILDIIMGLLEPTEGSLEIDGQGVNYENQRSWQAHIAHVPQVIFLADASIEENIAFGINVAKIDRERIRRVAQQAKIANIIESWPDQYQTVVGERGVQLSGGQCQRIGIARALYKYADVLILDEATSALDSATEESVMQAIETLSNDLTILIIAHRTDTLRQCTEIVELNSEGVVIRKK